VTLVVHALVLINIDSNMHGDEIKMNYPSYNGFKMPVILFTGFENWNLYNVFLRQFSVKSQFCDS